MAILEGNVSAEEMRNRLFELEAQLTYVSTEVANMVPTMATMDTIDREVIGDVSGAYENVSNSAYHLRLAAQAIGDYDEGHQLFQPDDLVMVDFIDAMRGRIRTVAIIRFWYEDVDRYAVNLMLPSGLYPTDPRDDVHSWELRPEEIVGYMGRGILEIDRSFPPREPKEEQYKRPTARMF